MIIMDDNFGSIAKTIEIVKKRKELAIKYTCLAFAVINVPLLMVTGMTVY